MTDNAQPQRPKRQQPVLSFPERYTPEYLQRRREAVAKQEGTLWKGVDDTDPKCPAGHARGIRISVSITSNYRQTHRKDAMDIKPQDVIDVLVATGITKWVLMGLHGYVGYLPQPRATQDVDVLIGQSDRKRAVKAVHEAWPMLVIEELEPVVRFKDPADCFNDGRPKPVIDLMLAWSKLNEAILKEKGYVVLDEQSQHFIPTVEAALASKYAALISDYRDRDKKEYDAGDFRRIARANYDLVQRDALRRLGDLVWEGGGAEVEEFLELANRGEAFPI
ncbi:MAG: hypothetical protein ABI614_06530 [Planctomycetota bacterium]